MAGNSQGESDESTRRSSDGRVCIKGFASCLPKCGIRLSVKFVFCGYGCMFLIVYNMGLITATL